MKAVHTMFFIYSSSTDSGRFIPLAARTRKGIAAELRKLHAMQDTASSLPLEYSPGAEGENPDKRYVLYLATAIFNSITEEEGQQYTSVPLLIGQEGHISFYELTRFVAIRHHILPEAARRLVDECISSIEESGHEIDRKRLGDDHAEAVMEHFESWARGRAMEIHKERLERIRLACGEIVTSKEENEVLEYGVRGAIHELARLGVPLKLIARFTPNSTMVRNDCVADYGAERALRLNPFYDLVKEDWTYDFYASVPGQ